MAKQALGIGTTADDGTGDTLRGGGTKIKENFDELYDLMGDGTDDPLQDMLEKVLNEDVDFEYNKEISLYANGFIDFLNKEIFEEVI